MKLQLSFAVEIDPNVWADTYGVHVSDVPADVLGYAREIVLQQFAENGVTA